MTGFYEVCKTDCYREGAKGRVPRKTRSRRSAAPSHGLSQSRADGDEGLVGRTRVTMRKGGGGSTRLVRYFLIKLPVFSLAS